MENKSVFEMILSGEIDSDIIYEDEQIFAIHDINPVAKVHILIIPKKKIPTINDMSESDINLIGSMFMCCLLYTSPSPRDATLSRMPSSA